MSLISNVPDGADRLVDVDYDQAELRTAAALADEPRMQRVFADAETGGHLPPVRITAEEIETAEAGGDHQQPKLRRLLTGPSVFDQPAQ